MREEAACGRTPDAWLGYRVMLVEENDRQDWQQEHRQWELADSVTVYWVATALYMHIAQGTNDYRCMSAFWDSSGVPRFAVTALSNASRYQPHGIREIAGWGYLWEACIGNDPDP